MPEREETTRRQRDDAEGLARLIQHKCKHAEGGACFECLHDGLAQDVARKERIRAEWDERMRPKEKDVELSPRQKRRVRIGCALVLAAFPAWWVFSSWMEASTYAELTGKDVSTWDAMWVQLRVGAVPGGD
ncbi:MAG TPA: hypothetical protein VMZ50_10485 [Phycisphaerae bacterium]|nr:hypothetical protein [Phycisphaerae bacterium]